MPPFVEDYYAKYLKSKLTTNRRKWKLFEYAETPNSNNSLQNVLKKTYK